MATAPEELEPGSEEQLETQIEGVETEEQEDDPYAPLAQRMGWVPKSEYRGDPEKWKPAEQFIIDGHEIQRNVSKELRELKSTVDVMSRTTGTIVEQRLAEQRRELEQAHAQAVEDGDAQAARAISREIDALSLAAAPKPSGTVEEWRQKNPWFQKDPLATDLAFEVCERLARQGFSHAEQLEAAERRVLKEYPELFPAERQQQRPPAVGQPRSRQAIPSNRAKGFHDMPKPAQDVAVDMENRGLIKRDDYVKQYWAEQGKPTAR